MERVLRRASGPILGISGFISILFYIKPFSGSFLGDMAGGLFAAVLILLAILYVIARVHWVVECLIELAHLPDGVFELPNWSHLAPLHTGSLKLSAKLQSWWHEVEKWA